ncbi:MAG: electron transport complex subunit RsxB [Granulosicoccus sp.]
MIEMLLIACLAAGAVAVSGFGLAWLAQADTDDENEQLIETLNRKLPQTQCAQCGYPGCRPYAQAIIAERAPINLCPPGGQALIDELAEFLGTDTLPLDSSVKATETEQVAFIVESDCIGCTLCIAACPVDAIVGASRFMHTVIEDRCTGCELCIPPCPVDCIELRPVEIPLSRWQWPKPA